MPLKKKLVTIVWITRHWQHCSASCHFVISFFYLPLSSLPSIDVHNALMVYKYYTFLNLTPFFPVTF
jgi:hypothetical protein